MEDTCIIEKIMDTINNREDPFWIDTLPFAEYETMISLLTPKQNRDLRQVQERRLLTSKEYTSLTNREDGEDMTTTDQEDFEDDFWVENVSQNVVIDDEDTNIVL